ncbi:hypothetical protein TRIP_B250268 [uncultured Desulfatiglans sp.]|nr:hypothetical protein TRIP_B250268 [uncultured Desulfatiglans sp.]
MHMDDVTGRTGTPPKVPLRGAEGRKE